MEELEGWFTWQPEVFYQPPKGSLYAVLILNHALNRQCVGHVKYLWQNACVRVCVDGGTNDYHDLMYGPGISTQSSPPPPQPALESTKNALSSLEASLCHPASLDETTSFSPDTRPSPTTASSSVPSSSAAEVNGLPHPLTASSNGTCEVLPSPHHLSHGSSFHPHSPLPNFISGDFDSVRPELLKLFAAQGVKIIPTPDQDETDFTKAIKTLAQYMEEQNIQVQHIMVIAGVWNNRFDQVMGLLATLFKMRSYIGVPVIMLSGGSLMWLLQEGRHKVQVSRMVIESPSAAWCGLIPLGHPAVATTTGLKWNLKNQTLAFGTLVSTSNTYDMSQKGIVTITTSNPILWTMGWVRDTLAEACEGNSEEALRKLREQGTDA